MPTQLPSRSSQRSAFKQALVLHCKHAQRSAMTIDAFWMNIGVHQPHFRLSRGHVVVQGNAPAKPRSTRPRQREGRAVQGSPSTALLAPSARQPLVSSSLSSGALPHLTATCVLLASVPAEDSYVSYADPESRTSLAVGICYICTVPGSPKMAAPKFRYYKWLSKPPT